MKAVLDTCILVDYLNGVQDAATEMDRYRAPVISIVTWMEVLIGSHDVDEDHALRAFLSRFRLAELDRETAEVSGRLRRQHRIALPDAVIWATAVRHEALLITRDTGDFPPDDPGVRVPYRVD